MPNKKEIFACFNLKFNMDHFLKVLREKEKLGIFFHRDNEIKDHPLVGKKCICLDNTENKVYIVDRVVKNWHLGFYVTLALVDENRSHRMVMYENISCHETIILNDIEDNKKIVQFID
jgi:hypothetical protein